MSFREATIEDVLEEPVDASVYERLAEAAMIVPIDADGGWRFCHPLIHDAAYSSLLAIGPADPPRAASPTGSRPAGPGPAAASG